MLDYRKLKAKGEGIYRDIKPTCHDYPQQLSHYNPLPLKVGKKRGFVLELFSLSSRGDVVNLLKQATQQKQPTNVQKPASCNDPWAWLQVKHMFFAAGFLLKYCCETSQTSNPKKTCQNPCLDPKISKQVFLF